MALAAMCTAVIAVCAQITIPMPSGVPVTLQTFAVALCGFLLTPKLAASVVTVYLMLGAVGVPVFSGFGGGMGVLFAKTGGFLLGFLALAVLASLRKKMIPALLLAFSGLVILHLAGVGQFMLVTGRSFVESAMLVSVPFLLKDAVSIVLAKLFADRLTPLLRLTKSS